jgi:hypothetical protein
MDNTKSSLSSPYKLSCHRHAKEEPPLYIKYMANDT